MDVATVIRNVKRSFGDDGDVLFDNPGDYIDWINDGQMQIARQTGCLSGTSTGAASTYPLTYPADFMRVGRLRYGNYALDPIRLEDLDAKKLDLTSKDRPFFYYPLNGTICLFPDPTDTDTTSVVLNYVKTPVVITVIGDALTVPVHYHPDVITWCLMKAHERNENYRMMEMMKMKFDENLGMRNEDYDNPDESYSVIRDDPWEEYWV